MFEKLEQLAKDNKKISDFHIRAGSPLAYRLTGEIIMEQETLVTAQDLKDLLLRDGVKNFTEIVGNKTLS